MAFKKKKKKTRDDCPYPNCTLKFEHDGDHKLAKKGGPKPGPKWTPALRKFIEELKAGKTQTQAAQIAYPNDKNPDVKGCMLMKRPLVKKEMAEYQSLLANAALKAAEAEAKELGKRRAVTKADVMHLLWTQANMPNVLTNGNMNAQVRAALGLSEILGMKIGAQNPDKFEGFTDSELEQFAKDGTVPERFASRFGIAPGGPSTIM